MSSVSSASSSSVATVQRDGRAAQEGQGHHFLGEKRSPEGFAAAQHIRSLSSLDRRSSLASGAGSRSSEENAVRGAQTASKRQLAVSDISTHILPKHCAARVSLPVGSRRHRSLAMSSDPIVGGPEKRPSYSSPNSMSEHDHLSKRIKLEHLNGLAAYGTDTFRDGISQFGEFCLSRTAPAESRRGPSPRG